MVSKEIGRILENSPLIEGFIYKMAILAPGIAKMAKPGQFIEIKTGKSPLLRKPISLYGIDDALGTITFLYQVKGEGTLNLSLMGVNDPIDLLGPLGNGFTIKTHGKGKHLLVGGGIGIAPLLELGKVLKSKGETVEFILGFSSKEASYAMDEFHDIAPLQVATMDGSLGTKGTVGAILDQMELSDVETIYACGPEPMLRYLQKFSDDIDVELSLEAYMGCGLGACLSCVCEKKDGDYARVCKDGPVFKGKDVVL